MLWDINIIPNEQDNGYLMLPPGVLHMSALGRFGRFTLFSPRVSHSKHLPCSFCFVLCFGFGGFVALLCFCFLFCKCFGIPNSPRSLDLDDRQGLIASSAMQQKKNDPSSCQTQRCDSSQRCKCKGSSGQVPRHTGTVHDRLLQASARTLCYVGWHSSVLPFVLWGCTGSSQALLTVAPFRLLFLLFHFFEFLKKHDLQENLVRIHLSLLLMAIMAVLQLEFLQQLLF